MQFNLHDGTNLVTKEKININDSVELDFHNKVKNVLHAEKGKKIFVISGKSIGLHGKISNIEGKKANVKLDNGKEVELDLSHIMVV